jgi:hypothetical protein
MKHVFKTIDLSHGSKVETKYETDDANDLFLRVYQDITGIDHDIKDGEFYIFEIKKIEDKKMDLWYGGLSTLKEIIKYVPWEGEEDTPRYTKGALVNAHMNGSIDRIPLTESETELMQEVIGGSSDGISIVIKQGV